MAGDELTPDEYEQLVASVLRDEGWSVAVTPTVHDLGLDVIAERDGMRLGVQAKMFLRANRPVNAAIVMHTYGAAAYFECDRSMIATDGRVLGEASRVADKLGVEIRTVPSVTALRQSRESAEPGTAAAHTFGRVWADYVEPLAGRTLRRSDGRSNSILAVDSGGILRRTSNGKEQRIPIETFRWTIERLLRGETVLREDINAQAIGRVSSGVMLVLGSVALFETTRVGGKQGLRMRTSPRAPA
jgi:restriction system protein